MHTINHCKKGGQIMPERCFDVGDLYDWCNCHTYQILNKMNSLPSTNEQFESVDFLRKYISSKLVNKTGEFNFFNQSYNSEKVIEEKQKQIDYLIYSVNDNIEKASKDISSSACLDVKFGEKKEIHIAEEKFSFKPDVIFFDKKNSIIFYVVISPRTSLGQGTTSGNVNECLNFFCGHYHTEYYSEYIHAYTKILFIPNKSVFNFKKDFVILQTGLNPQKTVEPKIESKIEPKIKAFSAAQKKNKTTAYAYSSKCKICPYVHRCHNAQNSDNITKPIVGIDKSDSVNCEFNITGNKKHIIIKSPHIKAKAETSCKAIKYLLKESAETETTVITDPMLFEFYKNKLGMVPNVTLHTVESFVHKNFCKIAHYYGFHRPKLLGKMESENFARQALGNVEQTKSNIIGSSGETLMQCLYSIETGKYSKCSLYKINFVRILCDFEIKKGETRQKFNQRFSETFFHEFEKILQDKNALPFQMELIYLTNFLQKNKEYWPKEKIGVLDVDFNNLNNFNSRCEYGKLVQEFFNFYIKCNDIESICTTVNTEIYPASINWNCLSTKKERNIVEVENDLSEVCVVSKDKIYNTKCLFNTIVGEIRTNYAGKTVGILMDNSSDRNQSVSQLIKNEIPYFEQGNLAEPSREFIYFLQLLKCLCLSADNENIMKNKTLLNIMTSSELYGTVSPLDYVNKDMSASEFCNTLSVHFHYFNTPFFSDLFKELLSFCKTVDDICSIFDKMLSDNGNMGLNGYTKENVVNLLSPGALTCQVFDVLFVIHKFYNVEQKKWLKQYAKEIIFYN